jgi:hypothetical protein
MHAHRRNALIVGVLAAIDDMRLSVTGLGRAIDSPAKEKHCIKRADRLIGNPHLFREYRDVYQSLAHIIVGTAQHPVILIDWSDLDPYKRHFLLRASVAVDGRALSIYEEGHELGSKEKPKTHKAFIIQLQKTLPSTCRPIIVTDSGFRTPWFKLIEKLGWDWVGRIRNRHLVRVDEVNEWYDSKTLYAKASSTPKYLGCMQLTRRSLISCRFVRYKGKSKGRSKITCTGGRTRSKHSEQCARRERDPWLLATSLPVTSKLVKKSGQPLYRPDADRRIVS